MAFSPPQGTKDLFDRQLSTQARDRWPQLSQLRIRFALHLASAGLYEDTILPTGSSTGTAEETLDCACELYLMAPDF